MDVSCHNTRTKKHLYLEALRVFAIFFVIFNHSDSQGFLLFTRQRIGGSVFWCYLFISIFCKFAVPVFFSISGALMLGRYDEPTKKWLKNILSSILLLVLYSLIYYVKSLIVKHDFSSFSWKYFFITLYSKQFCAHLWFLYAYIAYLLLLPFLRAMVHSLPEKYYYYLFGLSIFFLGVLPSVEYLVSHGDTAMNHSLNISWFLNIIILCPCLGYYLHTRFPCKSPKMITAMWVFNFLTIAISCYMTFYKVQLTDDWSSEGIQTFHNSFAVTNCVTIFITAKYIFERIHTPAWAEKIIYSLGSCTFGVYVWHILFKEILPFKQLIEKMFGLGLNYMLSTFIMCFVIFLLSYFLTLFLSKIPVLKKIVRAK